MITPTIGRRVWYWPSAIDADQANNPQFLFHSDPTQPLDAGIAYVHSDTMVNLSVADQIGINRSRVSVRLLQDDEVAEPGQAYAQWMPYQVAQAEAKSPKTVAAPEGDEATAAPVAEPVEVVADPVADEAPVAAVDPVEVVEAAK